ncbi:MAG TPA: ParB/RepB/Spo0J family partition protein [Ktedonobacteraceae bacterium]|nr:ParB/RepB/Spo0J family partition protein [Ktedonobacteraceae bacterium]
MAKQKFGLGRGLDALISGASDVIAAQQPSRVDEQNILKIALDSIIPNPRQPRKLFREDDPRLLELSASIKEYGLLQPLLVTRLATLPGEAQAASAPAGNDWFNGASASSAPVSADTGVAKYQIIAGERRWRASRLAGLSEVPVIVKEVTPLEMLELALIENIQREDLNPIEEALAYQALISEFGMTQEQVAKQVGRDRSTITNALRLLQLAPKVREALINQYENFTEGHARALVGITREEDQVAALGKIVTLKLNVRQAEELAARIKAAERADAAAEEVLAVSTPPRRSADLEDLETQFRDALTVKVDLKYNAKGKGTLVLHFSNQEELERLYSQLVKKEL